MRQVPLCYCITTCPVLFYSSYMVTFNVVEQLDLIFLNSSKAFNPFFIIISLEVLVIHVNEMEVTAERKLFPIRFVTI